MPSALRSRIGAGAPSGRTRGEGLRSARRRRAQCGRDDAGGGARSRARPRRSSPRTQAKPEIRGRRGTGACGFPSERAALAGFLRSARHMPSALRSRIGAGAPCGRTRGGGLRSGRRRRAQCGRDDAGGGARSRTRPHRSSSRARRSRDPGPERHRCLRVSFGARSACGVPSERAPYALGSPVPDRRWRAVREDAGRGLRQGDV